MPTIRTHNLKMLFDFALEGLIFINLVEFELTGFIYYLKASNEIFQIKNFNAFSVYKAQEFSYIHLLELY